MSDAAAVGVISLIPGPRPELKPGTSMALNGRACVEMVGVAILPDYQHEGVGSALVSHVLTMADGKYDVVWAHARSTAIGFFERHGFRAVGKPYDILPGVARRAIVWTSDARGRPG